MPGSDANETNETRRRLQDVICLIRPRYVVWLTHKRLPFCPDAEARVRQTLKPLLAVLALFGGLLTTPLGLLAAIALGPVILGLLCATVFGLIVFALWSGALGIFLLGRRAYTSVRGRQTRNA